MALLHQATLTPTKLELLSSWLSSQPWLDGADTSAVTSVGAYRFDDPDGEVGIETHLLKTADGRTLQVPVTYRAAPLSNAESLLIGTTQHSVLGKRWVYDGCGDVVYVTALAATILNGGHEAPLDVVTDDGLVRREATTKVSGSGTHHGEVNVREPLTYESRGSETHVKADNFELVLVRVINEESVDVPHDELRGTWVGQYNPIRLAFIIAP